MNVKDLIEHLKQFDETTEVMILDGENGNGEKREINFTPLNLWLVEDNEQKQCGDCEYVTGQYVALLGYGFY